MTKYLKIQPQMLYQLLSQMGDPYIREKEMLYFMMILSRSLVVLTPGTMETTLLRAMRLYED